ncbi:MAG: hypothetical protein K0R98_901 [Rickettsiaceae bacterium]|nr:hypothetical protein [Rickettsiaceae bacterium]
MLSQLKNKNPLKFVKLFNLMKEQIGVPDDLKFLLDRPDYMAVTKIVCFAMTKAEKNIKQDNDVKGLKDSLNSRKKQVVVFSQLTSGIMKSLDRDNVGALHDVVSNANGHLTAYEDVDSKIKQLLETEIQAGREVSIQKSSLPLASVAVLSAIVNNTSVILGACENFLPVFTTKKGHVSISNISDDNLLEVINHITPVVLQSISQLKENPNYAEFVRQQSHGIEK